MCLDNEMYVENNEAFTLCARKEHTSSKMVLAICIFTSSSVLNPSLKREHLINWQYPVLVFTIYKAFLVPSNIFDDNLHSRMGNSLAK